MRTNVCLFLSFVSFFSLSFILFWFCFFCLTVCLFVCFSFMPPNLKSERIRFQFNLPVLWISLQHSAKVEWLRKGRSEIHLPINSLRCPPEPNQNQKKTCYIHLQEMNNKSIQRSLERRRRRNRRRRIFRGNFDEGNTCDFFWGADLESLRWYRAPPTDTSTQVQAEGTSPLNPPLGCNKRTPFVVRPSMPFSVSHLVAFSWFASKIRYHHIYLHHRWSSFKNHPQLQNDPQKIPTTLALLRFPSPPSKENPEEFFPTQTFETKRKDAIITSGRPSTNPQEILNVFNYLGNFRNLPPLLPVSLPLPALPK